MPVDFCKEKWGQRCNVLFNGGFYVGPKLITQSQSHLYGGIHSKSELTFKSPGRLIRDTVLEIKSCNAEIKDLDDGTLSGKVYCKNRLVTGLYMSAEARHNAGTRQTLAQFNMELSESVGRFRCELCVEPDWKLSSNCFAGFGHSVLRIKALSRPYVFDIALTTPSPDAYDVGLVARYCSEKLEVNACRESNGSYSGSLYWMPYEAIELASTFQSSGDNFSYENMKFGFVARFPVGTHSFCSLKLNNNVQAGLSYERHMLMKGVSMTLSAMYDGNQPSLFDAVKLGLCLKIDPGGEES